MRYDKKGKLITVTKKENDLGGEDIVVQNEKVFFYKNIRNEELTKQNPYRENVLYKRIILTNIKLDKNTIIETAEGDKYLIITSSNLRTKYLLYLDKYEGELIEDDDN